MSSSKSFRVQLLVYDLSRGLATTMSQSILGQRIDGIWHTGILIWDTEYFYGGGIQMLPANHFTRMNGLSPVQIIELGETQVSRELFHDFLASIRSRFTAATYDLIRNNCNNFSNECNHFLTGKGIPSYIVDLPSIVFSTPGGAMLRPMIENMMSGVNGGAGGMDPFGGSRAGPTAVVASRSQPPPTAAKESFKEAAKTAAVDPCEGGIIIKPLVSGDVDNSLVGKLGNKIISYSVTGPDGTKVVVLNESEIGLIRESISTIENVQKQGSVNFADAAFILLIRLVREHASLQTSCLFFIRLMVLYQTLETDSVVSTIHEVSQILKLSELSNKNTDCKSLLTTGPAKFMAICTLANYYSRRDIQEHVHSESILNSSIDIATAGMIVASSDTDIRPEVRQVATALAHNIVLFKKETWTLLSSTGADGDVHPHAVQLLCCALERIEHEQDNTVLHRRLSIAYSVLSHVEATRPLCLDLGFLECLNALKTSLPLSSNLRSTETNDVIHKILMLF